MKKALIVEDLPQVGSWLVDLLDRVFPGIETTLVNRCQDALARMAEDAYDLALVDLGLPDGTGVDVIAELRRRQPGALSVVVTIYDDDEHLFPALQAGAFGYLLKEQDAAVLVGQMRRILDGEPPLSPSIARRMLSHFTRRSAKVPTGPLVGETLAVLTERETDVLQRVAKGYTVQEIAQQFALSRHTVAHHIKQVYRKLNVSSRAEATLEAARLGLVEM